MFCEKCGTENEAGARFCEGCGAALTEDGGSSAGQGKGGGAQGGLKKALLSKGTIAIAVEVIVLAALIVGVKFIGDAYYDPVYLAGCYFETLMEGDLGEAYDYLDIQGSEFLSKEMFRKTCDVENRGRLSSFTAKEKKRKENAVMIEVTYRLKNETGDQTKQIIMEKKDKKFFLFHDWKVNPGSTIKRQVDISAPSGAKVLLDDVELSDKYKKGSEGGTDAYTIDALFCGNHVIKASRQDTQEVVQTEYINPNDDSEWFIIVNRPKLKKEKLEQISKNAQEVFRKIMEAKSKGQDSGFIDEMISHKKGAENTKKYYGGFLTMNAPHYDVDHIRVGAVDESDPQCLSDIDGITDEIIAEVCLSGQCHYESNNTKITQNVLVVMVYAYVDGKLSLIEAIMSNEPATS